MMAKKTSWAVGHARKKAKKAKRSKPNGASLRGEVKGFGITKEKLAKALGEMNVAEALEYLNGPEPRRAGISDEVVSGLKAEITSALEDAKRAAAQKQAATKPSSEVPSDAASSSSSLRGEQQFIGAESSEEASEQATREWREYCAEALAEAEKIETARGSISAPDAVTSLESLAASKADEPPLFKPRGKPATADREVPAPAASANNGKTHSKEKDSKAAVGFDWAVSKLSF